MSITDESAQELKGILQEDFKKEVSQEQARKFGEWILQLYAHLQNNQIEELNADSS